MGISVNTVSKYAKGKFGKCKCGLPAGHKGWCRHRYMASEARQAYQAIRRGEFVKYAPPIPKSLSAERVATKAQWLDYNKPTNKRLNRQQQYTAISSIDFVCKNLSLDIKDDVRHHMVASCINCSLPIEDIPRSLSAFVRYYNSSRYETSADAKYGGSNGEEGQSLMDYVGDQDAQSRWDDCYAGMWSSVKRITKREEMLQKINGETPE